MGTNRTEAQSDCFDRFDYFTIEKIFSFLSHEEKTKFERLSKRIQSVIRNSVTDLEITDVTIAFVTTIEVVDYPTAKANNNGLMAINKRALKSNLIKYPNIERIHLWCFVDIEDLLIIGEHCPKLYYLRLNTIGLSSEDLDKFGQSYGCRLEYITFYNNFGHRWDRYILTSLLKHCYNLRVLNYDNNNDYSTINLEEFVNFSHDNNYLPKLIILYNKYVLDTSWPLMKQDKLDRFAKFCQKYSNQLEEFRLACFLQVYDQHFDYFMSSLCKLHCLQCLHLELVNMVLPLDGVLYQLSQNMKELKFLIFFIEHLSVKAGYFLEPFTTFRELFCLRINFHDIMIDENRNDITDEKQSQSIETLEKLIISCKTMNDKCLTNIEKYFPRLKKIYFFCRSGITDNVLTRLSKLTHLRVIEVYQIQALHNVTDSGVCALISGCSDIRLIKFDTRPNITSKTIEALISCAERNPKRKIKFDCHSEHEDIWGQIPPMVDFIDYLD